MSQIKKISFKAIDLTHTLSSESPSWDGDHSFNMSIFLDYKDHIPPDIFRVQKMETNIGMGTHIDAPSHCIPGGLSVDELSLDLLVTDCVVIKLDDVADENYIIMPSIVEQFEHEYGKILPNSLVIFYTGWDRYWGTPEKYINGHRFPCVHISTANMLLERNIAGLGIDTLSSDTGAEGFPVHRAILGAGKYLVENIANSKLLPNTGAKSLVLPMKIKDGSEAPLRLIALIPE